MNTIVSPSSRKRPVNLTLSDDVVQQARGFSSNLSAVVETLLAEYVRQQTQAASSHSGGRADRAGMEPLQ